MKKKLLLINPWIYDFAAFDLWSKPLGLLYIASFLRQYNYEIAWIDCLDKYAVPNTSKVNLKKYGTGHFNREIVDKPKMLEHIPRPYARYGMSESEFISKLKMQRDAKAILITSLMTYWYLGVKRVVELCRQYLPNIPIILGGIYASLLPEHAKDKIKPDYLIEGPGEIKVLHLLNEILNVSYDQIKSPIKLDDYPYPAFDLIHHPDYMLIMTARGCPYNCTFCAQKIIAMSFTQRNTQDVIGEFIYHYEKYNLKDFAFYDDALFINKDTHINIILEQLIETQLPFRLHSPNGLFANSINIELAELMYRANFKTIRLSFETSNEKRRKDMFTKVSNLGMIEAVDNLIKAGFKAGELESYVLMGLPNQSIDEIIGSIIFVNNLGVKVRLASFSPIPGTVEYEKAVESGQIDRDIDPLLTNNSIFPLNKTGINFETFQKLKSVTNELNRSAEENKLLFKNNSIENAISSIMRTINE